MDINFSNVNPVPFKTSSQQKLESKNAAHRVKFGSPKLRDLLREKCRIRMKESRENSYNMLRSLDKTLFNKILRQEIASNVDADIELQEEIYKELLLETQQWLIEEFEKEESKFIQEVDGTSIVCPICQISSVKLVADTIVCDCGLRLNGLLGLDNFYSSIENIIKKHESVCNCKVSFFTEPKFNQLLSLHVLCDICDFYSTVID